MTEEPIAEIGLDADGSLFVRPRQRTFPAIFRAAMEVGWDPDHGRVFSPPPRGWPHLRWFQQILAAVASQYGTDLILSSETLWRDIPPALRNEIEVAEARRAAERRSNVAVLRDARARRDHEAWFRDLMLKQVLDEAARLWAEERYADYAQLLAQHRRELSPAQLKRLSIAKRRAGLI